MASSERVHKLKLLIGGLEEPTPREFLPAPLLPSGLPRGVIVELLGTHRTEWLVQFLRLHPDLRIFWAERDQQILPTALHQRGVNLNRVTFGNLGEDLIIPLRRVLQSQLYQIVITPNRFEEIRVLKAFQLFAEKSNAVLFLMGDKKPSTAWPISWQLDIGKGIQSEFNIEILRQKLSNANAES